MNKGTYNVVQQMSLSTLSHIWVKCTEQKEDKNMQFLLKGHNNEMSIFLNINRFDGSS